MCGAYSKDYFAEPSDMIAEFEKIRVIVESEFSVEEGFVERGIPTFYVRLREDSKEAFLRLTQRMESLRLTPVLRKTEEKVVLRITPKPSTKPSRTIMNIGLLLATLGTVFISGYLQSLNVVDALMFTGAIIAILGSHEMGHKLFADKHDVEATYPYFIPGPPPIGTFGALIQQKSLPPNKDALFDLGATGPIFGFLVALVVAIIGLPLSHIELVESTAETLPAPMLFQLVVNVLPPRGIVGANGDGIRVIMLHPLAFAGWVGMFITLVNLVPAGMLDGGHVTRSFLGDRTRTVLAYLTIAMLFAMGPPFYLMAMLALFFSMYRHPGALDDVSKITTGRKIIVFALVLIFILCVDWFRLIETLTSLFSWI